MVGKKQLHYLEIMEYLLFMAMHVIYSAWTKELFVTRQVFIYAVGMSIVTATCLIVIKNEFFKQIGFSLCVMLGVHLIGTAMSSLAFGICIYMAAGTVLSIYGERRLNYYYFIIVNMTIAFELIMEYDVIAAAVPMRFYVMMVLTCEIYLLTEGYMVILYQQKVEEIQIQNELLNIAQKSKDEFLANMSHEIRTPMNAIVGMSELIMREENSNPKISQYCHNIQSAGNNLLAIINDILDFSKIESGKMNIMNETYSIAASVNDVVNTAMFRRGYKDIAMIVDISPDIPRLLDGDEIRIRQILTNIITNAIKFTEQGCVFTQVSCYQSGGNNWLKVSVTDTGIGIKKEDLVHLFESFKRLDSKKNRSIEGTGLGLPICKRMVELMHGTIKIHSEYGKGTTVTIDIPQRVIDRSPSMTLKEKDISVLTFLLPNGENYDLKEKYYHIAADHMWEALSVHNEKFNDVESFRKAAEEGKATHAVLGIEAYRNNREYIAKLSKKMKIFVYCDPRYTYNIGSGIFAVNLPFCAASVVSAINGEAYYNELADDELETGFVVPKANILVVDDNDLNRKVAEGILKLYKANCILVDSGREAINILKNQPIDIVFMDHMMPELDGVETTKIIRQTGNEKYRNVTIVAMTANAVNDVKQMFLKSGFQDFLPKPIRVKDVGVVLKHWLPRNLIEYEMKLEVGTKENDTSKNNTDGNENIEVDNNTVGNNVNTAVSDLAGADINTVGTTAAVTENTVSLDNVNTNDEKKDNQKDGISIGNKEAGSTKNRPDRDYVVIDENVALENMGGQRDLYKELLEYCLELEEKRWADIQEKFDEKDWKEYTILVHALKGGMRSLGIEELALAAQGQEFACKEDRIDDAIAGHAPLKELYDWTHRSIEHYLETYEV